MPRDQPRTTLLPLLQHTLPLSLPRASHNICILKQACFFNSLYHLQFEWYTEKDDTIYPVKVVG